MKTITNDEYNDYMEYKKAKDHGQIITPSGLRLLCSANDNNPERIGLALLDNLHRMETTEKAQHLHFKT